MREDPTEAAAPFTRPVPRATPTSAPFWEGLRRRELRIQCCRACSRWIFYPRASCPGWRRRSEVQAIRRDGERAVARNDVDVVRLDRHTVGNFDHRHLAAAVEHGGERAVVRWIEMLDDDIGDAAAALEQRHQGLQRADAAG